MNAFPGSHELLLQWTIGGEALICEQWNMPARQQHSVSTGCGSTMFWVDGAEFQFVISLAWCGPVWLRLVSWERKNKANFFFYSHDQGMQADLICIGQPSILSTVSQA